MLQAERFCCLVLVCVRNPRLRDYCSKWEWSDGGRIDGGNIQRTVDVGDVLRRIVCCNRV